MAAVIGVMVVGLLMTTMIATSIVTSTAFTSKTRAGVQSEAAAQAGIAAALAGLRTAGNCASVSGVYRSATDPVYVATVYYGSVAAWSKGCPPDSPTQQIRIMSKGTASATGVAGVSAGDVSYLEGVYQPQAPQTSIVAAGPAIYTYSSNGFTGSGTLVSVNGSKPNVLVKTGTVTCSGGASMNGDLVVNGGDLNLSGGCGVSGSAWASGAVTVSGNTPIGGSVVGSSFADTSSAAIGGSVWTTGAASFSGGSKVTGTVAAGGAVTIASGTIGSSLWSTGLLSMNPTSRISGNAVAGTLKMNGSNTITGSAWSTNSASLGQGDVVNGAAYAPSFSIVGSNVSGQVCATGAVTYTGWTTMSGSVKALSTSGSGTAAGGTVTGSPCYAPTAPIAPIAPSAPLVPGWIDFAYTQSDWAGFGSYTMPSGPCSFVALKVAIATFGSNPGVVDARNCSGIITSSGSDTIPLMGDVAIIAKNGFDLTSGNGFTTNSPHRLWLITPDTDTSRNSSGMTQPSCPTGGSTTIEGGFTFASQISTAIYSPCQVVVASGIVLNGQIFAGSTSVSGSAKVGYIAVGLPGVDLNTGATSPSMPIDSPWTRLTLRDVTASAAG